jgi:flagellar hook-associated protein 1 FlgK
VYVSSGGTDYYLVEGVQYGSLSLSSPPAHYTVTVNAVDGSTATVDSTMYTAPDGGELWATLQMRDTYIPSYRSQVDALAAAVVSNVNTLHTTNAYTPSGAPGGNFFNPAGVTAGSIGLAVTLTTQIAASGSATAPGDNSKAIEIAQLLDATTMSGGTATFSNYYNGLMAQVGLDVQSAQTVVTQDEAYFKQLTTLRESNSGVSLDEELATLIMYQRSYQASAKLITTAGEMLDTLINMVQ